MSDCTSTISWPGRLSNGPLEGFATWLFRGVLQVARFGDHVAIQSVGAILLWRERWRQRQALRSLNDHMLQDIGLSRADVEGECRKPFWSA